MSWKIRPVGNEFYADERTDGQTHRHDGGNSRFSQFRERAQEPTGARDFSAAEQ